MSGDATLLTAGAAAGQRIRHGLLAGAEWAAPAAALALGVWALRRGDVADIGSLGLVTALRPELYVALALLTAGFLHGVFRTRPASDALLAAYVIVLVVLLFGAAPFIEPLPRMIPGWLHVGFADYIARTGETLPELDARFSWPGFFALTAMATRVAGMPDAMPLLAWAPVGFNLAYGIAVFRLARLTSPDARAAWLALWLFFPANWVGQDYLGPQAMNYLFYLVLLMMLLRWFRPGRRDGSHRERSPRSPLGLLLRLLLLPPRPLRLEPVTHRSSPASLVGLVAVVLAVFMASTVSHQLTPIAIVVCVGALVLVRRCTLRTLPVLFAVVLMAYISYGAVAYWAGHLDDMFGSVGNVGGTINHGAVQRVRGDEGHQTVVLLRLVLTLVVWGLAVVGAWRRMRRGHADLGLLTLAGAPFLLLAMQSYGGEIFLRVYAFALPFMAILLSALLVPAWPARRRVPAALLAGTLSTVLIAAFFVARYGNEAFEQVRPADHRAVEWLYAHAPAGVSFVSVTSNVPWRAQGVERYRYRPLGEDLGPTTVGAIEEEMRHNPKGAYLIITEGQFVFAESFLGKPRGWGENLEREVVDSGQFRLVYTNPEARVYVLASTSERGDR
ncbi:hypothetical protein [Micromonospora cremea]|uniref:4-amino-4-deoxy-L-arabinose transferase n=1 Tax=Micromonospora cremea TaxID=709881 RepID=A0A1N5TRM8_9ACTN|nr:hypothetical protein [Micromonospora cremea]SIM50559.1 hypothetical protein SAMN04489832_0313 [Micromonospora cremea]